MWTQGKLIFDYLNQDICKIKGSFGKMTMCTFLFNNDMGKNFRNKKFFCMLKKNPKFDCLIFGNWSNLPPEKEQSPTWISCKTHECSNHQLGNMKKQPPTMPNFFFWFLANKLFYCRYHHKCSNHQPECDFKKKSQAITCYENTQAHTYALVEKLNLFSK